MDTFVKNGDPKRAEISVKEKLKVYMEKNNVAAIAPAKAMPQAENKDNDKSASSSSANQDPKLGNPSHQKDQSCNICYNEVSGVKYFHHQFSTQTVREGNKTSSLCTICRQVHSMERPLRRRILITCSTLYRCWEHTEFKPSCCFDVEAIVGGTFEDGERALRLLWQPRTLRRHGSDGHKQYIQRPGCGGHFPGDPSIWGNPQKTLPKAFSCLSKLHFLRYLHPATKVCHV